MYNGADFSFHGFFMVGPITKERESNNKGEKKRLILSIQVQTHKFFKMHHSLTATI